MKIRERERERERVALIIETMVKIGLGDL